MKNISRRVFIKGMAVAAVATAASTVLAGCNVPGIVEETPVAGFQPVSKTLTFGDKKTVEMTAAKMSTTMDDMVKVDFNISNKSGKTLYFKTDKASNDTNLSVLVRVYLDDEYDAVSCVDGKSDMIWRNPSDDNIFTADTDPATGVSTTTKHEGCLYVDVKDAKWNKMTIVMDYIDNNQKDQQVRFVLNK